MSATTHFPLTLASATNQAMTPIEISLVVFACLFLGALMGAFLRSRLPEHHLASDSKDAIKLGTGLIGTMAALLLGLLVASAKSAFDTKKDEVTQMAAKVSFLDRVLAHYGPEASEAREMVRHTTERVTDQLWPPRGSSPVDLDPTATGRESTYDALQHLSPKTDAQTALKSQALATATDIAQTRWLLLAQKTSSISLPMLAVVVFWLTTVFVSFGLFAPANATVVITQFLCALAVAGAIFLMLELDQPFGGIVQIPSAPMHSTLEHLGK